MYETNAIYIAGPMRSVGPPTFNFPAFDAAAERAATLGFGTVYNPAQMDRDDPHSTAKTVKEATARSKVYAERDLAAVMKCSHIALLPGWEKSDGARCEHALAVWLGLTLWDATTMEPFIEDARFRLLKFHEEMCAKGRDIMRKKNHDYTGQKGNDPFANFRRTEQMGICSTEQGFLVRLSDKLSRLSTFTSGGKLLVEDESVFDTLVDTINYSVLFGAFLKEKALQQKPPTVLLQVDADGAMSVTPIGS